MKKFNLCMLVLATYVLSIKALLPPARCVSAQSIPLHSVTEPSADNVVGDGSFTWNVVEYNENKGGDRAYGKRRLMQWDQESHMFAISSTQVGKGGDQGKSLRPLKFLTRVFYNNFVPSGNITQDYFTYSKWRACQRFVSATSSVFGTQALVMALGVKSGKNLGIAAATAWVMKDALGKISRILWASNFGRKFDSDAKKWRYRASLLYAAGSTLEVMTYLFPRFFLIIAATANGFKQMAMLTSSATRNAIYRSFARKSDNIGDVTAKGEAQIAIVDLLGIFAGVFISKRATANRTRLVATFLTFSVLDLFCIYNEIQSVIFNALNYERAHIVLEDVYQQAKRGVQPQDIQALGPAEVGRVEKILLPAHIRENIFSSWSGLCVMNSLLKRCLKEQQTERQEDRSHFVVTLHAKVATRGESLHAVVGVGSKLPLVVRGVQVPGEKGGAEGRKVPIVLIPQVLLHRSATKEDMLRALIVVHRLLGDFKRESESWSLRDTFSTGEHTDIDAEALYSAQRLDEDGLASRLSEATAFERGAFVHIKRALQAAGWEADKYMFGSVKSRVEFGDGGIE
jgi:hypothetical protein